MSRAARPKWTVTLTLPRNFDPAARMDLLQLSAAEPAHIRTIWQSDGPFSPEKPKGGRRLPDRTRVLIKSTSSQHPPRRRLRRPALATNSILIHALTRSEPGSERRTGYTLYFVHLLSERLNGAVVQPPTRTPFPKLNVLYCPFRARTPSSVPAEEVYFSPVVMRR
jgi:hypothetical protein